MKFEKSNIYKIVVISIAASFVMAIMYYCIKEIINTDAKSAQLPFYEHQVTESDKVWGAIPSSACNALSQAYLVASDYTAVDGANDFYKCETSEVDIEGQKERKTLQYSASGFADKATSLQLVMKIVGDQNSDTAMAARKSWAIYSALLSETVFSQVMSEDDMQRLSNLDKKTIFSQVYNQQFVSKANVVSDGFETKYIFNIQGLPVVDVK